MTNTEEYHRLDLKYIQRTIFEKSKWLNNPGLVSAQIVPFTIKFFY